MKLLKIILAFSCLGFLNHAQAMSVSWQGSTAVMTSSQPFLTDWLAAYSFRNDMAVAGRIMRMTMSDGTVMKFYAAQFDYLARRWNGTDYQANIYANAGFGAEDYLGRNSTVGIGTLDIDVESRELYAAGKIQGNWVGIGPNVYQGELRLGIAPYKAAYEELASWFIVSIQTNAQLSRAFSVTPMVRLFYKSVLAEVGSNIQGDWMLNTMIHF